MTAPLSPAQAAERICCNCQKIIIGGAMTSGGVFWHPYSCLSIADSVADADSRARSSSEEVARLRSCIGAYFAALDSWNSSIAADESLTGEQRAAVLRAAGAHLRALVSPTPERTAE